jgi:hypothetical protein
MARTIAHRHRTHLRGRRQRRAANTERVAGEPHRRTRRPDKPLNTHRNTPDSDARCAAQG